MNTTEKAILSGMVKILKGSTTTNWTTGDTRAWSDYANKMKNVIDTICPLLNGLIESSGASDEFEEFKKEPVSKKE